MGEPMAVVRRPATVPADGVSQALAHARARVSTRTIGAVLLIALFGVFAATAARGYVINDVFSAEVASWRLAGTGTPWLDGVHLQALPHVEVDRLWLTQGPDGQTTVSRSPGVIAAGVPAYFIAGLVNGHANDPAWFSYLPGGLMASLLTALAMLFLWLSLDGLLRESRRLLAVLAVALTTPVWSIAADGMYTHTVTLPGLAGLAWAVRRERWWLAGVFGGIALWGRLHAAVIVAIVGLGLAAWRRRPRIAVEMGLVSGVFLGLASVWSWLMYGHLSPTGGYAPPSQYAEKAASGNHLDQLVNQLGLLVAPDRGLLVWTPVLLLLLPAVVRHWRQAPDWTRLLAAGGLVYLVIQGLMNGFSGGYNFYGYRLTLETLLCLTPLYAVSAIRAGRCVRMLLGPVLGLQLAAFSLGGFLEPPFLSDGLAWRANAFLHLLHGAPILAVYTALMVAIGALAAQAWGERRL
ncbi:hypothetical protein [Nocardioides sp. KR10-350]|uniref:hypothetical protein n=1 Tax=Nocardioides cheoyonin TaxID=3156615 RepID=UPI0032B4237D